MTYPILIRSSSDKFVPIPPRANLFSNTVVYFYSFVILTCKEVYRYGNF